MFVSDNDNSRDNFGIGSSQEANSPRDLVAQIKLEREILLHQIEANQSTIMRSQRLIARLNSLLAKLGDRA
jgi:hypothetical protein